MFEPLERGVGLLVGSVHLSEIVELLDIGHHNSSNWIVRIVPVDQRLVILVGAEGKLFRYRLELLSLLFVQAMDLFELVDISRPYIDEIHEVTPLIMAGPWEET